MQRIGEDNKTYSFVTKFTTLVVFKPQVIVLKSGNAVKKINNVKEVNFSSTDRQET